MIQSDSIIGSFGFSVRRQSETGRLAQAEKADIDRTCLGGVERGIRNLGVTPARLMEGFGA